MKTIWIYDAGNGKTIEFPTADAAQEWFAVNDPEGVAFEHPVPDPDANEAYEVVPMKPAARSARRLVDRHQERNCGPALFGAPEGRGRTLRHRPGAPRRDPRREKAFRKIALSATILPAELASIRELRSVSAEKCGRARMRN